MLLRNYGEISNGNSYFDVFQTQILSAGHSIRSLLDSRFRLVSSEEDPYFNSASRFSGCTLRLNLQAQRKGIATLRLRFALQINRFRPTKRGTVDAPVA